MANMPTAGIIATLELWLATFGYDEGGDCACCPMKQGAVRRGGVHAEGCISGRTETVIRVIKGGTL